jgi:transposase
MGKPYSMDLRERVFCYIAAGNSRRAAARVFGVSASTAVRLAAAHRERGAITPKRQGRAPGTAGKLAPHMAFLAEIVRAEPDITLKELSGALKQTHGVSVQLSSIHRALIRAGFSYKKRPYRAGTRPGGYQAGTA